MHNRNLQRGTIALLIGLALIRGLNFTAIKISLTGLTPLISSGWRNTIAAIALLGYVLLQRRSLWPSRSIRLKLLGMGALFTVNFLIVYTGMNHTTASRAAILLNSQPLAVALMARLFLPSDRISTRRLMGLLMAFLGVVLVLGDPQSSLQFKTLGGDLFMLLAAFNWAILVILRKQVAQRVDPAVVAAWEVAVGMIALLPVGWMVDRGADLILSLPVMLALLFSGLIGGALVFGLNIYLIKCFDVNAVSSFNFMIPVVGTVAGILLLNEPFGVQVVIGMSFVAAGIYVANPVSPPGGKIHA